MSFGLVIILLANYNNPLNLAITFLFIILMTFLLMWYQLRKNNNFKKSDSEEVDIRFYKNEIKKCLMDDHSE
ncbi:MAG: hypothetical protein ACOCV1_05835 [Bacillota bacterium]